MGKYMVLPILKKKNKKESKATIIYPLSKQSKNRDPRLVHTADNHVMWFNLSGKLFGIEGQLPNVFKSTSGESFTKRNDLHKFKLLISPNTH